CRRWRRLARSTGAGSRGCARAAVLPAAALLRALELAAHLAVLRDRVGLFGGRVEIRGPLPRAQPRERLRGPLWVARHTGPLHFLDRARELWVLTLERGLRRPLHQPAEQGQLHQRREDRLQEAPALDPPEQGEDAEDQQEPAQDVQREEVEPDRARHDGDRSPPPEGLDGRARNTTP